jgi:hypothetical protein
VEAEGGVELRIADWWLRIRLYNPKTKIPVCRHDRQAQSEIIQFSPVVSPELLLSFLMFPLLFFVSRRFIFEEKVGIVDLLFFCIVKALETSP